MAAPPAPWHNAIVGFRLVPPADLLAHPRNPRRHPAAQREALRASLRALGWIAPVIQNVRTGHLLDGHARIEEALSADVPEVPVVDVDLPPDAEALALATFDPITGMASLDAEALDALLHEVDTTETALQQLLADVAQGAGLDYGRPPVVDPPSQIDRAAELQQQWGTALGQLWAIPSRTVPGRAHRLLCGDSTDTATVARLMNRERLRVVWTDPPYGVSYAAKNEMLNAIAPGNRIQTPIMGDHLSEDGVERLVTNAFRCFAEHGTAGAAAYVAAPAVALHTRFIAAMNAAGFMYRHQLVWVKNQFVLGRSDYFYRHEPVLYGWLQNGPHYFEPRGARDSVFEIDKPRASKLHPTEKPVALVQPMLENSSPPGEVVADPFSGSGTTFVAAEAGGRVCYGMELAPEYVAVTLQRLQDMGLTPERVSDA